MNRIFKRKLVFVKVCSPFSFIRFTNAEKIPPKKRRRPQEPILIPRFTSPPYTSPRFITSPGFTSPRFTSPVQSSPVQSGPVLQVQCAQIDRTDSNSTFFEANKTRHKKKTNENKVMGRFARHEV